MTAQEHRKWRAAEAHALRMKGLTYPAIAKKMRCSLRTVRRYVKLWERFLRAGERARRMHMQWFGPTWQAPVNQECDQVATPVGSVCKVCELSISEYEEGFLIPRLGEPGITDPVHLRCFLYAIGAESSAR